jgi:hypothetical protein
MIVFNPKKRISIEEAIEHPYAKSIKEEGTVDPVFTGSLNFEFD